MEKFLLFETLSTQEAFLRIGLAMLFSLVIGLDRDRKNKPIDFRAYMIIAVATCTIAMLSQELAESLSHHDTNQSLEYGKVMAGCLTGIGFLGAGAIIKLDDNRVVGTATGASIWASGGMGLTLGFGFYGLATLCFLSIVVILVLGGLCMHKVNGTKDREKDIS